MLKASQHIENNEQLIICPSILSSKNKHYMVQINNFQDHPYTLKRTTHIANFSILTREQMKNIQPIDQAPIRLMLDNNHAVALQYVDNLIKTPRSYVSIEIGWFHTLQSPDHPSDHTPIQKRTLRELYALALLGRLDPQGNQKSRDQL